MYKRLILLISILLFASLAAVPAVGDPNLLGWWTFDDGTADDSSGNNHDGTFVGNANTVYDSERDSNVLSINSTSSSGVNCGGGDSDGDWADITESVTMAAWVKINTFEYDRQYIASKGNAFMMGRFGTSDHLRFYTTGFGSHDNEVEGTKDIQDEQWHFVVFIYDRFTGARYLYVDARIDSAGSYKQYLGSNGYDFFIGGYEYYADRRWKGLIDDVRLYDRALSKREIRILYGSGFATEPSPADGAGNISIDVNSLSWKPGEYAADVNGHDVYFGTDWYEVNEGNQAVHIGLQDGNSFDPGTLEGGTTYYWAIDAVNDGNVWPGYIWSFRTATEGFYKELFKDSGLKLNGTTEMPAVEMLALSYEHLSLKYGGDILPAEQEIQDAVFIGDGNDDNGVLLYPDGEPRFRYLYIDGGASGQHGDSLGEDGRERMWDFYHNGGSYSGSCAGAFIASSNYSSYLHIWPGYTKSQPDIFKVGYDLTIDSPLLDYYDFGGDLYIEDVQHWNGPYVISGDPTYWCEGTEVCTRFDAPGRVSDGHVSIWAYKADANSGRLVPIASHPERITSGEQRDLMAAVLQYGMDGQGSPAVKASLQNGITRSMNDNNSPGHEKIGDLQYHHFTIDVPSETNNLTITLDGDDSYNLDLFAMKGGFAFNGEPNVTKATNGSGADEAITIDSPDAGTWYIGVKCVTTVSTIKRYWGWDYTGNVGVLNGVSYTIRFDSNEISAPDPNLVAWYTFDNDDASDSSGYGHDGTLVGDANVVNNSNRGKVLELDGDDDYVNCGKGTWADIQGEITVAAWIKVNQFDKSWQTILAKGNSTYRLQRSSSNNYMTFWLNTYPEPDCRDATGTVNVNDGEWHHVAGVFDGDMVYLYVDGLVDDTTTFTGGSINTNTYDFLIGKNAETDSRQWNGWIDDVRIYNRILSEREILNLSRLVARYTFDDEDATDSSGNGHDGTVIGDVNFYDDPERDMVGNFPGGTGNYINCGGGGGGGTWADITDEITVMAWVKTDGYTIAYQYVGAKESSWRISRYSTTDQLRMYNVGMVPSSLYGTNNIQDGEWHHVAGVYNGSNRYLYIDGDVDASDAETGSLGTNTFAVTIGGTLKADSLARTWVGQIDDFRIYDKGLTETQIEAVINATN